MVDILSAAQSHYRVPRLHPGVRAGGDVESLHPLLPDGNDVYFKANMLHEFGGEGSINMLAANGEVLSMDKDYGDTWFELGIGTNIKLGHASYFYGDIERGFSGDIDKKWQINAGLRFEF